MNREEWLEAACNRLKPWVEDCAEAAKFEMPLVSVGWPKGHRGRGHAIGQCWDKVTSGDKQRAHIFLAPDQTDPLVVLGTLLHELVHASVGTACGHRREFRKVCLELGFEPPMRSTPLGEDLSKHLENVSKQLGKYPHPGLISAKKKVGSRMLKAECGHCGCIVRITRVWLDSVGPPTCGCGNPMHETQ